MARQGRGVEGGIGVRGQGNARLHGKIATEAKSGLASARRERTELEVAETTPRL
jgi:hypothetical protein